jgi:hypothetical protein
MLRGKAHRRAHAKTSTLCWVVKRGRCSEARLFKVGGSLLRATARDRRTRRVRKHVRPLTEGCGASTVRGAPLRDDARCLRPGKTHRDPRGPGWLTLCGASNDRAWNHVSKPMLRIVLPTPDRQVPCPTKTKGSKAARRPPKAVTRRDEATPEMSLQGCSQAC